MAQQVDLSVFSGIKPPDISQFADSYMKGSDFVQQQKKTQQGMMIELDNQKLANEQNLREREKLNDDLKTTAQVRHEKRRNFIMQIFGQEAEALESLPETARPTYYREHLIPNLQDEGFDTSDMPEYSDSLIQNWKMGAMSPGERSTERENVIKREKELFQSNLYKKFRQDTDAYVNARQGKMKQADLNTVLQLVPPELSGYAPFEKHIDNLKMQPQPPWGMNFGPKTQFEAVMSLRKDFDDSPLVKAFGVANKKTDQVNESYRTYNRQKAMGNPNAQFLDKILVNNFMKMIDELSAVLPGEVTNVVRGAGISDRLIGQAQSWLTGGIGFNDNTRQELVKGVNTLMGIVKESTTPVVQQFINESGYLNADPYRVIGSVAPYFPDLIKLRARDKAGPSATPGAKPKPWEKKR